MKDSPIWQPSAERIQQARITQFRQYLEQQQQCSLSDYPALYQWSIENIATFWKSITEFCQVKFHRPPQQTLTNEQPMQDAQFFTNIRWFQGSTLNYAEHLLSRRDNHPAIISYDESGRRQQLSYAELFEQVTAVSYQLKAMGVAKGDRVVGMLPNCSEAIIAMLATASLGAVWSSCSPDFGTHGVVDRFGQIEPKVFIACSGYYYNGKVIDCRPKLKQIQQQLPNVHHTVILQFLEQPLDISEHAKSTDWAELLATPPADYQLCFESCAFDDPLFILYSSGTTGKPKCIVHGVGGTLLQHLKEHQLHTDITDQDVLFYFTTCGWMMWNWLVSGLASGATLVLYDGSPFHPEPTVLWDMAEKEHISVFGTSAKYIAALEKAEVKPAQSHQLPALKAILSTGSPLSHESFDYVYRDIKQDVCLSSISGGTDIISCFALGNPTLPVYRGQLQCRGLGMAVEFYNEAGEAITGEKGELVCKQPFPSMPIGFWQDPDGSKYHKAYFSNFPGIWCHGDYGELTEQGGVIIHGRADAVLNPGGVRIGTAEIYRQVEQVPEVLESIAVGQQWQDDVRVVLFVKLKPDVHLTEQLTTTIKKTIREHTTPRHVPAKVLEVADIPRTISGKIVELAVRKVIHNETVDNTDALANPEALEYFRGRKELLEE
ncbi:acetoacetate--CoA ligase [Spartinivicinus poritis]|uniref:Acetoacetate--CoA ligase n=1 Tax=Spartinivicinus poritis TaxID=2994640 RepID=A0ABT5U8C5_9GAMM|nr:acetoacetate--CoA ligase [Spartinivicinus sp. A2-2]MDE1462636.1 acetoacetate--CoA ligase [Spartinivicinus sp. A2-2]